MVLLVTAATMWSTSLSTSQSRSSLSSASSTSSSSSSSLSSRMWRSFHVGGKRSRRRTMETVAATPSLSSCSTGTTSSTSGSSSFCEVHDGFATIRRTPYVARPYIRESHLEPVYEDTPRFSFQPITNVPWWEIATNRKKSRSYSCSELEKVLISVRCNYLQLFLH